MDRLRAGFAQVVITPPVGVKLAGYSARTARSKGVLDDLMAKALVLDNGTQRLAILSCDLLELNRDIVAAVRARVQESTGMDPRGVMVAATHTHCGPDLDLLGDQDIGHFVEQAAGAVSAAANAARPAAVGFGTGHCRAGANRRNRRSTMGPYFLYNDPDGTMDDTVAVTSFRGEDGAIMGALVNYACHPVTLGDDELLMSKDFVHFTCETLKGAWGPASVALFLQGCAGNVNPDWIYDDATRDPLPERVLPADLEPRLAETRRIGHILGGAALSTAASITRYSADVTLAAVSRAVDLPVRKDLPSGMTRPPGHPDGRGSLERTRYIGLGRGIAAGTTTVTTEVQALRIGDSLIVGLPGEIFVEWQLQIRERLAPRHVLVVELANDSISYLPTPEAFREGGYEPLVSFFTPEAGGMLAAAAVKAAGELSRG